MIRDVNEAGRVRIQAPSYPTRQINICPIPVPYPCGYPLCRYPHFFFKSTDIHGYPRVFTERKILYLTTNFNYKFK